MTSTTSTSIDDVAIIVINIFIAISIANHGDEYYALLRQAKLGIAHPVVMIQHIVQWDHANLARSRYECQ